MASYLDVCRFTPTLGGTTDWTYSAAVTGYQSPTAAGAVNATVYRYRAESLDLSQWEIGYGAYNSGTGVFARTTILFNSSGGTSKINFTTVPQVAIVAIAEDLPSLTAANSAFTGTMSVAGSFTALSILAQPAAGANQAIATLQNISGGSGSLLQANQINILSDNYNAGSSPGTAGFAVNHVAGGTSMQGGRNAISGTFNLTSASAAANPLKEYVAVTGNATASANDGGTNGTPAGAVYGSAFVAIATSAATFLEGVKGSESGVAVQTTSGNAPNIVANWSLVQLGTHAASGKLYDASLMLSNTGGIGMLNGIDFNSSSGAAPVGTTGTLIATHDSATVANGIDFSSYTISGNFLKATGFTVTGAGALTATSVTSKVFPGAGTFSAGQIYTDAALGLVTIGKTGSVSDYSVATTSGTVLIAVPTGSLNLSFNAVAGGSSFFAGGALSTNATAGVGYSTGAGGTVTQLTSRITGVTINKICGAITLFAAAPAVGTWVSFTVINSAVVATDLPKVAVKSGTNTYIAHVTAVAAGSFQISITSIAGTSSDSPVINFAVMKGVTS